MVTLALYGLLAIGLIGGLFLLAARLLPAGEQIAPSVRDEPIWSLPEGRFIGATDVAEVRLPVALRGYRFAETDQLLDRLVDELRSRDEELARLRAGGQAPPPAPDEMTTAEPPVVPGYYTGWLPPSDLVEPMPEVDAAADVEAEPDVVPMPDVEPEADVAAPPAPDAHAPGTRSRRQRKEQVDVLAEPAQPQPVPRPAQAPAPAPEPRRPRLRRRQRDVVGPPLPAVDLTPYVRRPDPTDAPTAPIDISAAGFFDADPDAASSAEAADPDPGEHDG